MGKRRRRRGRTRDGDKEYLSMLQSSQPIVVGSDQYALKGMETPSKPVSNKPIWSYLVRPGNYDKYLVQNSSEQDLDWDNEVVRVLVYAPTEGHGADRCPLCLSDPPLVPRLTSCCMKVFCLPCLLKWKDKRPGETCPLCKGVLEISKGVWYKSTREIREGDSVQLVLYNRSATGRVVVPEIQSSGRISNQCPLYSEFTTVESSLFILDQQLEHKMIFAEISLLADAILADPEDVVYYRLAEAFLRSSIEGDFKEGPPCDTIQLELNRWSHQSGNATYPTTEPQILPIRAVKSSVTEASNPNGVYHPDQSLSEESFSNPTPFDEAVYYRFYQVEGSPYHYLSLPDIRLFVDVYGSYNSFPPLLTAKVKMIRRVSLSANLLQRARYLAHLPAKTPINFLYLDWEGMSPDRQISPSVGAIEQYQVAIQQEFGTLTVSKTSHLVSKSSSIPDDYVKVDYDDDATIYDLLLPKNKARWR